MPGPCSGLGVPGTEAEVGLAPEHGIRDPVELARVERTVAVHEADDVGLRGE